MAFLKIEQEKLEKQVYDTLEQYDKDGNLEEMKQKVEKLIQVYEKRISRILDL